VSEEDKAENDRAGRNRGVALEHLIEDRARTPSELSAKVAIAIDWLRCDGSEHAMAILSSVMLDLRMMELQGPPQTESEDASPPVKLAAA
jgi:hypothetical protein